MGLSRFPPGIRDPDRKTSAEPHVAVCFDPSLYTTKLELVVEFRQTNCVEVPLIPGHILMFRWQPGSNCPGHAKLISANQCVGGSG